ncbi:MAG: ribosome small subunit-dependent GTPase A [Bacteroidia bacterium]
MVIRSTGYRSQVRLEDGSIIDCAIRGKFRIKGIKATNPVAVGDHVDISMPGEGEELGYIHTIHDRDNYILRRAIGEPHKVHVLAANVDQAILLYTVSTPHTTTGFANRFLIIAEAFHIPVRIIFNKTDLINTADLKARHAEIKQLYETIGYPTHSVSALDEGYREEMEDILKDKISFIGGHSGAGKSTLINLVDPDLNIRTGDVSDSNSKGRHTTTFAEMHPLRTGGYIIDSPGIKEMGVTVFDDKYELSHYFPEMRERLNDCKFNDCMHLKEPGCAVRAALANGEIHPSRYNSYLSMLEEDID